MNHNLDIIGLMRERNNVSIAEIIHTSEQAEKIMIEMQTCQSKESTSPSSYCD